MAAAWRPLALALLACLLGGAAARSTCSTAAATSCEELRDRLDCFNLNPTTYRLLLSCAFSANYTCTGVSLTVQQKTAVTLSPEAGCQRPFRLIAGVAGDATTATASFITVTGPRARLYLKDVHLMLGGRRRGIEASGGSMVTLESVTVTSGRAERGGAVHATNAQVVVKQGLYAGNWATVAGGAFYVTAPSGKRPLKSVLKRRALQVSNAVITDNRAVDGGGISLETAGAVLERTNVTANRATGSGGGVDAVAKVAGHELQLLDCRVERNHAALTGGGARMLDVRGYFRAAKIDSNTASGSGAGVHLTTSGGVPISRRRVRLSAALRIIRTGSTLNNNTSYGGKGGALYLERVYARIYDTSFKNNTAGGGEGGAVYAKETLAIYTRLYFTGCTFVNNSGTLGGAVAGEDMRVSLFRSELTNNTGREYGGGGYFRFSSIYSARVGLHAFASSFSGNTAKDGGGALYLVTGAAARVRVLVHDSSFAGNSLTSGRNDTTSYHGSALLTGVETGAALGMSFRGSSLATSQMPRNGALCGALLGPALPSTWSPNPPARGLGGCSAPASGGATSYCNDYCFSA